MDTIRKNHREKSDFCDDYLVLKQLIIRVEIFAIKGI